MKQQLKYKITYGSVGDTAHARAEQIVYAFDIIQAIQFSNEIVNTVGNKNITKVERLRDV